MRSDFESCDAGPAYEDTLPEALQLSFLNMLVVAGPVVASATTLQLLGCCLRLILMALLANDSDAQSLFSVNRLAVFPAACMCIAAYIPCNDMH